MGNGCRELAHCGEASNPGELLSCFVKLLLADLHYSLRHFDARSYPSPEYFGCAFAMVRVHAREKRREIVGSLLPLLGWGLAMVGRHPRRLEVITVDEIASAIRCNRPCDCWHVI